MMNDIDAAIVIALQRPECYPHPVARVRLLETHISWVLLTGEWAYKVKKPVNLGFLDFSTLESRRHFCAEELRLNRRLAPQIYESVVEIRGTPERPRVEGAGPVLEYAVKMREFPQDALASALVAHGALSTHHVDLLAQRIAEFHSDASLAGASTAFGTPDAVALPALQNFEQLVVLVRDTEDRTALDALRNWTERAHARLHETFAARRNEGYVRECHGDLHLRNIAVLDGRPVAFDCIEFDERLRWIDVMNEVAFLVMDFRDRGRSDYGWRFLNGYLEATGDYAGIEVLSYYMVYRALVRAKVHAFRARQPSIAPAERQRLAASVSAYLRLASDCSAGGKPALLITHGVSGSGKTSATQPLIETAGAVRVRSDVERKRLHGTSPLARSASAPGGGLYTAEATRATYDRLLYLAGVILEAGCRAVIDAAFLKRSERDSFRALARRLRVPFLILAFTAPPGLLRERVAQRLARGSDASEADMAVLERQLTFQEALGEDEEMDVIRIDTRTSVPSALWKNVFSRINPES